METKDPVRSDAKKLPQIKDAMQKHHDFYLNLKPEEVKEGDLAQIEVAKQREEKGEVKPLSSQ